MSNRIYLEDRIAGDIPGTGASGAGLSGAVVESRRIILRAFFKARPSRFLPYGCKRSGRYTTTSYVASFGEVVFANMSKGKAYLIFL